MTEGILYSGSESIRVAVRAERRIRKAGEDAVPDPAAEGVSRGGL